MTAEERENLVKYRLRKAWDTLAEVNLLLQHNLLTTAVNRLYYSCYYAVIALLIKSDLSPSTHAGVRQMFGLHFVKTGIVPAEISRFYTEIFGMRQTGDYDDFIDFEKAEIEILLEPAHKFISAIEEAIDFR